MPRPQLILEQFLDIVNWGTLKVDLSYKFLSDLIFLYLNHFLSS